MNTPYNCDATKIWFQNTNMSEGMFADTRMWLTEMNTQMSNEHRLNYVHWCWAHSGGCFYYGNSFPLKSHPLVCFLFCLLLSSSVCPPILLLFPSFMDSPLSNFLFSTNTCTSCLQLTFCRKKHSKLDLMCFVWAVVAIFFWNWMGLTLFVYLVTSAQRRQPTLHFSSGDLHAKLYSIF